MNDNTPNEHMSDEDFHDAEKAPDPDEAPDTDDVDGFDDADTPAVPHPVNWNLLSADDLEAEWLALNDWVAWLRRTYGLPVSVLPPFWHRHPELVWELSALHLHWLGAYDPEQNASAAIGWHRDFADARTRLRDWVAASGTRLDHDRPTRQAVWPGEEPAGPIEDTTIADRGEDFVQYVFEQVQARREAEDAFFAGLDLDTGELP